jgi:hypothetical protein
MLFWCHCCHFDKSLINIKHTIVDMLCSKWASHRICSPWKLYCCEKLIPPKPINNSIYTIWVDVVEWSRSLDVRLSEWCCSVSMVWVQIPSREEQNLTALKSNSNTVWFNFQTYIYIYYMLFSYQTGYIMWHSRLMIYIPWAGNVTLYYPVW